MASAPRIRTRAGKIASLAVHAARSLRGRRQLEKLAPESAVARALLAVSRDQFTADERRTFAAIDAERAVLYARQDSFVWRVEDPVDPASLPAPVRQEVGRWARYSSVKPHWGRLLYALVREVRPATCLELGACFGISGLYIQAAQRHTGTGTFVTFEGSRERAEIARANYGRLGFNDATIVIGDFDRHLAPTLATLGEVGLAFIDGNHRLEPTLRYDALIRGHARSGAVLVHDDIRWSSEMIEAWHRVSADRGARAFDVFRLGIVELDDSLTVPELVYAWLGLAHLR